MKRNILITGGTSGIGAALAKMLDVSEQLYVCGSRPRNGVSDKCYIIADQNDPNGAADSIAARFARDNVENLDLAILNAGIGFWRDPSDETCNEIRATLDINLASSLITAHQLFPFLERVRGKLVLIGSTSHNGQGKLATYAASKAALDGFARALRSEWQGRVQVQIIHPGPTDTAMHGKAGLDTRRMKRLFASPELTAKMIVKAIRSGRLRTSFTLLHRIAFSLSKGWIG